MLLYKQNSFEFMLFDPFELSEMLFEREAPRKSPASEGD